MSDFCSTSTVPLWVTVKRERCLGRLRETSISTPRKNGWQSRLFERWSSPTWRKRYMKRIDQITILLLHWMIKIWKYYIAYAWCRGSRLTLAIFQREGHAKLCVMWVLPRVWRPIPWHHGRISFKVPEKWGRQHALVPTFWQILDRFRPYRHQCLERKAP